MYRTVKIYTLKPTPQQWPHPHSLNQSPVAGVVKIRFVQIQLICQQSRCGTVRCGAVWCEQGARRASTSSRQGSAVFSVQCAVCSVQCAVCSVQCAVCSVQCAVCSVQCAVCSVQCGVCSVQCAVCSVQCAVCSVQCAVCCAVQCLARWGTEPGDGQAGTETLSMSVFHSCTRAISFIIARQSSRLAGPTGSHYPISSCCC
jgi:hypothetical protein